MKIIIRVDSSDLIGSGHVMRCLTLADKIVENGSEVIFITRKNNGSITELIKLKGFSVYEIGIDSKLDSSNMNIKDNYDSLLGVSEKTDANETIEIIKNLNIDWIIIDHYSISLKWQKLIRPFVKKIMVIDDLANRMHDCDMLLDQNWFKNNESRYTDLVGSSCTLLLGPKFLLLRDEFIEIKKHKMNGLSRKINRVFVFFGGSDPSNLSSLFLKKLIRSKLNSVEVDIVIGKSNQHINEVKKIAQKRSLTNLHIQTKNMASLISKADIAIGSGGFNLWECIYLDTPSIVFPFAQNQKTVLKDLSKFGPIKVMKNFANLNQIFEEIDDLYLELKNKMIFIEKDLINHNGASEAASWINGNLSKKNWNIKNASKNKMSLYWEWANDTSVRMNSFDKTNIPLKIHKNWFRKKVDDPNCFLFIAYVENHPVGQVRFEVEKDCAKIDYSIVRQFRGRSLGKKLLKMSISEFRKSSNVKLIGEVIESNIASQKIFESIGFNLIQTEKNKTYIYN